MHSAGGFYFRNRGKSTTQRKRMMRKQSSALIIFAALIVLIALGYGRSSAEQSTPVKAQHWEYKQIEGGVEMEQFNNLGKEGWELVSVYSLNELAHGSVFKRPSN
jgi:hypothetical protein